MNIPLSLHEADSSSVGSTSPELRQPPLEAWLYGYGGEAEDDDEKENHSRPSHENNAKTKSHNEMEQKDKKKCNDNDRERKPLAATLTSRHFKNLPKRLFNPVTRVKKDEHYEHISLIHSSENPTNDRSTWKSRDATYAICHACDEILGYSYGYTRQISTHYSKCTKSKKQTETIESVNQNDRVERKEQKMVDLTALEEMRTEGQPTSIGLENSGN
jgi:hypothetical protein